MTTNPRVKAAAREMHRLEYGNAIDWDDDGMLHPLFISRAEAVLAAADAARALPADVAGLVERLHQASCVLSGLPSPDGDDCYAPNEAAAALTALRDAHDQIDRWQDRWHEEHDRAETAERERDRIKAFLSEGSWQTVQSEMAWKHRAETAERRLAVTTAALERIRAEVPMHEARMVAAATLTEITGEAP